MVVYVKHCNRVSTAFYACAFFKAAWKCMYKDRRNVHSKIKDISQSEAT